MSRAAAAAGLIAFGLVLVLGNNFALAQPQYWTYTGDGGSNTDVMNANNWAFWQEHGSNVPVTPTSSVNGASGGVSDIILNGVNASGWPASTTTPYRMSFSGQGGWSTSFTNFYNHAGATTSDYYPGEPLNTSGTAYSFPGQTATISAGEDFSGPNVAGGFTIAGNMHINVAGGNLSTSGPIWDEAYYTMSAAMIYDNAVAGPSSAGIGNASTPNWMWPDSITVSSGGSLSAAAVGSGFQGGATSAGNLTLGVVDNATVSVGSFCAGAHNDVGSTYSPTGPANSGQGPGGAGEGGGGLTLQGAGGSVTMTNISLLPSIPKPGSASRYWYSSGAQLNVVLDSTNTVASTSGGTNTLNFNTAVVSNKLEMDDTYNSSGHGNLTSPVNLQVNLAGYTPTLWDVIPVISVTGGSADLVQYNGSSALQGLGSITFNGQSVAWGTPFGIGAFDPGIGGYDYYMTAYQYNPSIPSQAGVYLQVSAVPEPGTLALLGAGVVGALVIYRRRRAAR